MTEVGSTLTLPADLEWMRNPYTDLARFREAGPVVRVRMRSGFDAWLVTRYSDVQKLSQDRRLSSSPSNAHPQLQAHPGFRFNGYEFAADSMLRSDPPDHTRLRRAVSRGFTARRVERLRPRVQEITDGLLDAIAPHGRADLVESFARPLPMAVICELLGVPFADRAKFEDLAFAALAPITNPAEADAQRTTRDSLHEYLCDQIDSKRREPGDDLISALVERTDGDYVLSNEETVSTAILLLLGGQETTANLIGTAVLALLRHPDQLAAVREHPDLLPDAIEEFLRYDGPIMIGLTRFATEDISLDEVRISAGDVVFLCTASANHDPERFVEPLRLDITRQDNAHAGFGYGIHYCLGAPLARLEGAIAIGALLRRFPDLALAVSPEEVRWRPSITRGLAALPVTF